MEFYHYVWHRTRLGEAEGLEMDVEGGAGKEMWIGESKWRTGRKANADEVRTLLRKGERLREHPGEKKQILRLWFFSHSGFTADAEKLMAEHGVFWSDRDDVNGLLELTGLKLLPEVGDGKGEVGGGEWEENLSSAGKMRKPKDSPPTSDISLAYFTPRATNGSGRFDSLADG